MTILVPVVDSWHKGTALLLQKSRRNQPQRPRVNAPQVEALRGGGGSELEKMGKIEGRFVGGLALLFLVILLEGLFLAGSVRPAWLHFSISSSQMQC